MGTGGAELPFEFSFRNRRRIVRNVPRNEAEMIGRKKVCSQLEKSNQRSGVLLWIENANIATPGVGKGVSLLGRMSGQSRVNLPNRGGGGFNFKPKTSLKV
ncbi:hypothetical protein XENTR_v10003493 [Xenopus tropicalis]|nr:hypothetical protein XENTR_v10003493 [Xenopus tropicalis]